LVEEEQPTSNNAIYALPGLGENAMVPDNTGNILGTIKPYWNGAAWVFDK